MNAQSILRLALFLLALVAAIYLSYPENAALGPDTSSAAEEQVPSEAKSGIAPGAVGPNPSGIQECPECSIILISIDSLRPDHLGSYGYPRNTSPRIDDLARDAVLFETVISQAPSTAPSHASMLTGLIPSHHKTSFAKKQPISSSATTLAEILSGEGYETYYHGCGGQLSPEFGFGRGFDNYTVLGQCEPADTFAAAKARVEELHERKYFLFLHTTGTHHPYTPRPGNLAAFERNYSGSLPTNISIKMLTDINDGEVNITPEDKAHIIAAYDAEILDVDENVGGFLAYLHETGAYDNTIIVFTADHGEEFGEHGKMGWHASTLYDELVRVPLIIKFQNSTYRNLRVNQQARSVDIMPTLLEAAGVGCPGELDGESLLPAINDGKIIGPYAISEKDGCVRTTCQSIRTSGWKMYGKRLFDLASDPLEKTDVSEENKVMAKDLQSRLTAITRQKTTKTDAAVELSNQTIEKLRSLGYI